MLSLRGMKEEMWRRKGKRRGWGVIFEEAEGDRKGRSAVLLAGRVLSLGRLREEERAEEEGRMGGGRGQNGRRKGLKVRAGRYF